MIKSLKINNNAIPLHERDNNIHDYLKQLQIKKERPLHFIAPYQYYNHFEFTENNRSVMIDLLEKDDVCKLLIS